MEWIFKMTDGQILDEILGIEHSLSYLEESDHDVEDQELQECHERIRRLEEHLEMRKMEGMTGAQLLERRTWILKKDMPHGNDLVNKRYLVKGQRFVEEGRIIDLKETSVHLRVMFDPHLCMWISLQDLTEYFEPAVPEFFKSEEPTIPKTLKEQPADHGQWSWATAINDDDDTE